MSSYVTKRELDTWASGGCMDENCAHDHGPLFAHAACHIGGEIEASYVRGSGVLRIACRECGKDIMNVQVAESADA